MKWHSGMPAHHAGKAGVTRPSISAGVPENYYRYKAAGHFAKVNINTE
jgi:hypothetical protein